MSKRTHRINFRISAAVLVTSSAFWTLGLLQSPLIKPKAQQEGFIVERAKQEQDPEYLAEKALAEAYWQRYPDIKNDSYFGEKGPMGINGAREHFKQYGKSEGRKYGPIQVPRDKADK